MNEITAILNRFGMDTVGMVQSNLSSTGTNASGETSASVKSEMVDSTRVLVTGNEFINVVETGRKPGKMPPVFKIKRWLETGKVDFSGTIDSTAWGIAKFISANGSKLYREGGRKDIITPVTSDIRIDKLTSDIADASLKIVVTNIEDWINAITDDRE